MELSKGLAVGICQTVVGFPLDTLKTWSQSYPKPKFALNLRNLYAGVRYPMMSGCLANGVVFGVSKEVHSFTGSWALSGGIAGLFATLVINPFDVMKIRAQMHESIPRPLYFRALWVTASRETPAYAFYFSTFHYCRETLAWHPFFAGAAAGLASWTTTYPIDVLKTRMQTHYSLSWQEALAQRGLWSGFSYAVGRALLVNGMSLWLYSLISDSTSNEM